MAQYEATMAARTQQNPYFNWWLDGKMKRKIAMEKFPFAALRYSARVVEEMLIIDNIQMSWQNYEANKPR